MIKMPNEHARKCRQKGCNSRAVTSGFKLFGVQIDVAATENGGESSIRKSKSLGNLQTCSPDPENVVAETSGYMSDGWVHQSSKSHDRKKGKPWSEEEHRSFLVGLEKLGKGDWKGIATNYVPTRNSSQVASHAQKYFIRMSATEKKRRRSSVFDIPLTDVNQPSQVNQGSQSDKAAETSQSASSWHASSKNIGEPEGSASTTVTVTTSERPPLSPMTRRGVPDFRNMFYPGSLQTFNKMQHNQGITTQSVRPTVAWIPFVTFPNQNNVILPNIHGTALAPTCAKFLPPPAVAAKLPQKKLSQAGGVGPATNDELDLNIRNLTL